MLVPTLAERAAIMASRVVCAALSLNAGVMPVTWNHFTPVKMLSHETMPGLMQKASVLLVTLADQPIFAATVPNKVQAYMAAGRPIIACLNGEGARLVVEAGAGLATPAEDARALADTILRLYQQSPAERETMGNNGRKYYQEHFNHDRLIDQLILILQDAAKIGRDI